MSNANDVRRAHKLLDYVSQGRAVLDEEIKLLRSFLPDLPKQKTLEEIIALVYDAWTRTSGNEWIGNIDSPDVSVEDWLAELYAQLKELAPAESAHPEFLETEADYENAPEGTIVTKDDCHPWTKEDIDHWTLNGSSHSDHGMARSGRRYILRWGWGE